MTLKKKLTLIAAAGAACLLATPSFAQDEEAAPFSVSANVSFVTDYRFRGVSLSDEDVALQGGFDVSHESGFYIGTWGSSIESFAGSELETDLYGGYGFAVDQVSFDVGLILYAYPGSEGTHYLEVYGSAGTALGPIDTSVGFAYAWDQDNIGSEDNVYIYTTADYAIPETPFSLSGSFGWEDGAFGDDKLDWSFGVVASFFGLDFGLSYVDTDVDASGSDATALFSLGASF